jgi:hypothetical protein
MRSKGGKDFISYKTDSKYEEARQAVINMQELRE